MYYILYEALKIDTNEPVYCTSYTVYCTMYIVCGWYNCRVSNLKFI